MADQRSQKKAEDRDYFTRAPAATDQRMETDTSGRIISLGPVRPLAVRPITRQEFWRGDPNAPDENRISPVPDHARTSSEGMRSRKAPARRRAKPSR